MQWQHQPFCMGFDLQSHTLYTQILTHHCTASNCGISPHYHLTPRAGLAQYYPDPSSLEGVLVCAA